MTEENNLEKLKKAFGPLKKKYSLPEFKYLMRTLDLSYEITPSENPFFISERCGKIKIGEEDIGYLGEISPTILSNLKIKMPIAALEINLEDLIKN